MMALVTILKIEKIAIYQQWFDRLHETWHVDM